jgi:putative SOS response-associated peptidase YedK
MCGRFTNRLTWREIVALYRLTVPATPERNLPARYNICPTTTIDAVIERDAKRELVPMRWGLVPSWWKKTARSRSAVAPPVRSFAAPTGTANRPSPYIENPL